MRVIESGNNNGIPGLQGLELDKDKRYIFLFRHGETNWNVAKKIKGHLSGEDTYFTERGYQQIECISEDIVHYGIEAIFSSDFFRTQETAKIVSERTGMDVTYAKELEGLNTGTFQGTDYDSFNQNPTVIRCFSDYSIPFPGGESINDLVGRITDYIVRIMEEYPYHRIAMISHGAAISNVKQALVKLPYEDVDRCVIEY